MVFLPKAGFFFVGIEFLKGKKMLEKGCLGACTQADFI